MLADGATVCTAPAPSRLRERMSTSPSRHTISDASRTVNGITASDVASALSDDVRPRTMYQAPPATSTPATATKSMMLRLRAPPVVAAANVSVAEAPFPDGIVAVESTLFCPVLPVRTALAASASDSSSSLAVCGRAAGSFSRHRITSRASGSGVSLRCEATGVGISDKCAISCACAGRSPNGGAPVSSSYAIAPKA